MIVKVVYKCWGCGSAKVAEEDIEIEVPVPSIEKWNLCQECIEGKDE